MLALKDRLLRTPKDDRFVFERILADATRLYQTLLSAQVRVPEEK